MVMETNEDDSTIALDPLLLDHQTPQWPLWNELTCFDVVSSRSAASTQKKNQNWAPGQTQQTWMPEQNCVLDYSWYCQDSCWGIHSAKFINRFFLTLFSQQAEIWEVTGLGLMLPSSPWQRSLPTCGGGNHLLGCHPPSYYAKCLELEQCPKGQ